MGVVRNQYTNPTQNYLRSAKMAKQSKLTLLTIMTFQLSRIHAEAYKCMVKGINRLNNIYLVSGRHYLVFRRHLGVIRSHRVPKNDFNSKMFWGKVRTVDLVIFDYKSNNICQKGQKTS